MVEGSAGRRSREAIDCSLGCVIRQSVHRIWCAMIGAEPPRICHSSRLAVRPTVLLTTHPLAALPTVSCVYWLAGAGARCPLPGVAWRGMHACITFLWCQVGTGSLTPGLPTGGRWALWTAFCLPPFGAGVMMAAALHRVEGIIIIGGRMQGHHRVPAQGGGSQGCGLPGGVQWAAG